MPYPFLFFAATPKTAFQHPCRLSLATAFVAAPLFIPSAALAALNCTKQPTCAELGYSKSSVDDCEDYLYCPFDTSYKKCVGNLCERLGYTKDSKNWCEDSYSCPYDNSYTACVGILSYLCPDGYTDGIYYEDSDCPSGYKVDTLIFNGSQCGTCIKSNYDCPSGYTYNLSLSDCGIGSWELKSHSDDKNCKKCQARNNCSDYTFTEKFGASQYSYMKLQIPYQPTKDPESLCKNGIMGKEGTKSVQCYACIPCIYSPWNNQDSTKPIIDGHYDARCVGKYYSKTQGQTANINVDNYENNMTSGGYSGKCPSFICYTTRDYDDMCYYDYQSECVGLEHKGYYGPSYHDSIRIIR